MYMTTGLLDIHYDVFSYKENLFLYNKILKEKRFKYGETDEPQLPPTGMKVDIDPEDHLFKIFENKIIERNVHGKSLQKSYVNLFLPFERPFFHNDGPVRTILFYINPKVNANQNGETQFLIDGEIRGILPVPGSMICFDGMMIHRATSFRNIPRITVAFKYWK